MLWHLKLFTLQILFYFKLVKCIVNLTWIWNMHACCGDGDKVFDTVNNKSSIVTKLVCICLAWMSRLVSCLHMNVTHQRQVTSLCNENFNTRNNEPLTRFPKKTGYMEFLHSLFPDWIFSKAYNVIVLSQCNLPLHNQKKKTLLQQEFNIKDNEL